MDPEEKLEEELEKAAAEVKEPVLDDDGNEIVAEVPAFMQEEEDDGTSSGSDGGSETVPLSALIKTKQKLKGKIGEQNDELETLREENARLKQGHQQPAAVEPPKRPRLKDFDDDDKYEEAMDKYEEEKLVYSTTYVAKNTQQSRELEDQQSAQEAAVESHYDRAAKLVAEHSISPEVFQKTDTVVKELIESIMPKRGEAVFDHLVTVVGEGSEKTMFYLGRNKAAQAEFQSLLARDKTGLQAALYLGRVTERISGSQSKISQAPAPAAQLKGDNVTSAKDSALHKKWQAAHKKGNAQLAYNIKKEARLAGVDTKVWR